MMPIRRSSECRNFSRSLIASGTSSGGGGTVQKVRKSSHALRFASRTPRKTVGEPLCAAHSTCVQRFPDNRPAPVSFSTDAGGTKCALPGRLPPIQFCVRRNSPGAVCSPRAPLNRCWCISRSNRLDKGNPERNFSSPYSRARTYPRTSAASQSRLNGPPGFDLNRQAAAALERRREPVRRPSR